VVDGWYGGGGVVGPSSSLTVGCQVWNGGDKCVVVVVVLGSGRSEHNALCTDVTGELMLRPPTRCGLLLTVCRSKMTDYRVYHLITKGQHRQQKIERSIQSETQPRKLKLINLNTTQHKINQAPVRLHTRDKKGMSSLACVSSWSTWARTQHLVIGRDCWVVNWSFCGISRAFSNAKFSE